MLMVRAITVLAAAFFLTIAFQTFQLTREHSNLDAAIEGQRQSFEQAVQVSQETQAFAGDTAVLADKGNANAKQVVEQMRQQGIALRAPQAGAAPTVP
jgi:hypothetical protein